jgi:hypothetical protein
MGLFDFLMGGQAQPGQPGGMKYDWRDYIPDSSMPTPYTPEQGGGGGWLQALGNKMKDPNVITAMGTMGAKMGGEGSFADAVGTAAVQMNQAEAAQNALKKKEEAQKSLAEQIKMLVTKGDVSGVDIDSLIRDPNNLISAVKSDAKGTHLTLAPGQQSNDPNAVQAPQQQQPQQQPGQQPAIPQPQFQGGQAPGRSPDFNRLTPENLLPFSWGRPRWA